MIVATHTLHTHTISLCIGLDKISAGWTCNTIYSSPPNTIQGLLSLVYNSTRFFSTTVNEMSNCSLVFPFKDTNVMKLIVCVRIETF